MKKIFHKLKKHNFNKLTSKMNLNFMEIKDI